MLTRTTVWILALGLTLGVGAVAGQNAAKKPAAATTTAPKSALPKSALPKSAAPKTTMPPAGTEAPAAEEEIELEEPKTMSAVTEDGVTIKFSYYKAPGEEAVPVVLLHGGGGRRDDFEAVAEHLQAQRHAVIVPDLRGHGGSTAKVNPVTMKAVVLSFKTQGAKDIEAMVGEDMKVIWNFLMKENNAKAVNIKKLCLVGVDMGAIVAANYAAQNWDIPDWRLQPRGKDVKALVLVSPPTAYRGASYGRAFGAKPFKPFETDLSALVMVGGDDPKSRTSAKTVSGQMSRLAGSKNQAVIFTGEKLKTKHQDSRLLSDQTTKAMTYLDVFIQERVVDKKVPWAEQIIPGAM